MEEACRASHRCGAASGLSRRNWSSQQSCGDTSVLQIGEQTEIQEILRDSFEPCTRSRGNEGSQLETDFSSAVSAVQHPGPHWSTEERVKRIESKRSVSLHNVIQRNARERYIPNRSFRNPRVPDSGTLQMSWSSVHASTLRASTVFTMNLKERYVYIVSHDARDGAESWNHHRSQLGLGVHRQLVTTEAKVWKSSLPRPYKRTSSPQ